MCIAPFISTQELYSKDHDLKNEILADLFTIAISVILVRTREREKWFREKERGRDRDREEKKETLEKKYCANERTVPIGWRPSVVSPDPASPAVYMPGLRHREVHSCMPIVCVYDAKSIYQKHLSRTRARTDKETHGYYDAWRTLNNELCLRIAMQILINRWSIFWILIYVMRNNARCNARNAS